jgi:hypothetical protein
MRSLEAEVDAATRTPARPGRANANPFGESAVLAAVPPVITSSGPSRARPGPFSAVAIADAVADAIAGAAPAVSDGAKRLTRAVAGDGVVSSTAAQYVYHFARVNAAATFSDALGRFINDCASLGRVLVSPDRGPAQSRARRITLAVIAADVVMGAYLLHRASPRRRRTAASRSA